MTDTAGTDVRGRRSDDGRDDRLLHASEWRAVVAEVTGDALALVRQLEAAGPLPADAVAAVNAGLRTMSEAVDDGDLSQVRDCCAAIRLRIAAAITEAR